MSTKRKKRIPLILALTLGATTLLAACSTENGKAGESGKPAEPVATQPPKKLSILLSHSTAKYAMQAKPDGDMYVKEMSRLSGYNLSFEFLGHNNDFTQQMTVRFASGDMPDLLRTDSINSSMHPGAVQQGVFTDLTELIDKYGPNIKKNIPADLWKSSRLSEGGKIYGIPAMTALPSTRVIYIRQDWLDKVKMPQPKTLDDYLKYFEAIKQQDMNGNGDPNDEYGFYVRENLEYSFLFFKEFGYSPLEWTFRDGKFQPGMIQPEMKDALKFWKSLYDNKYINPNLFTNKGADWIAGITNGKAGMWIHDVPNYPVSWTPDKFVNEKNVKINMIAPPTGGKGQGLIPLTDGISYVLAIPSKSKNAIDVIKMLNWAWSDEGEKFFNFGIKGTNYTEDNGTVKWDSAAAVNTDNDSFQFHQMSLNFRGDGRMNTKLLAATPGSDMLLEGSKISVAAAYKNLGLHMPKLTSLATHPELTPGTGAGTLFLDMFARVVTGKDPVDKAFDDFVAEWKKRGGEAAVKEATDWYNSFYK